MATALGPLTVGDTSSRQNLRDEIASHIRGLIFSAHLLRGQRIDPTELAAVFGVSKLPVREALIQLESEGLVDNIARRGAFVAMLDPDDFYDHFQAFGKIVAVAAERAATRISEEDLDQLERLVRRMEAWDENDRERDVERLNHQFHRIINRSGGSRRLKGIIRSLAASIPEDLYHRSRGWTPEAQAEHRLILTALRARDGSVAAVASARHAEAGGRDLVESLRASGFWAK
ncbi:GntR family transcriptional regulator [Amycolatopsis pithecellobii]|uniref:FCD domain-containing protein n=1 Tax=Amycolatopsis pithecellobii TaxID=664692 RepID=A0A6N7Z2Q6_9PSEU|nr:GntR family transcriptional regulator [Amycolatopsis pithecellobii]MTD54351.1 FCD domain-containing protein [Amycolatopsis pithecellobii]